ncbi:hypothetical protein ELD05_05650 [Caldicellulosiruptor changbaiensis]|uniref:Uncharacterized protein n=1 Tax=Caldicellulosiruptor changbaiensis TaxID=1222016 RepID=A0A3T0D533_9FIRM|nr:hypothetical protein [Caldicellulosiruptor changbaiensis]AZT90166.1 hypothetical protein ELD05_05650 [Caldicellulosiruptor changbaiensis]
MPKVTVNLPKPVYDKLCKLADGSRNLDEIITHASAILIDTIRRATKRELQTAHWFTIVSSIDLDYRKLLISFLDQGTELFTSIFEQHFKVGDMRECAQTLRVLILLEYLKVSLDNEGIEYLVELRYPHLDEEIKFWQSKGFVIPEKLLFKPKTESEVVCQ